MVNMQNEIRYRIAWGILKKLYRDGRLTQAELYAAHTVVADRYCPLAVCRLE